MGDMDLCAIRKAFRDIDYKGIFSMELGGADKTGLAPSALECYTKYAFDSLKYFDELR